MNKTLVEEELDRELIEISRSSGSIYDVVKAKVGNKKIEFETFHHEIKESNSLYNKGKHIYKSKVEFQKMNNSKIDAVQIEVMNYMKLQRSKICNLGHEHSTEEYDFNEWQRFVLPWECIEQLIEWFQTGRFYDARSKQAKALAHTNGFHSNERID